MKKISICTVCMNRLTYLRETLPVNIKENMGYPNIEFVLLDYNSQDGLEEWVKENMSEYIESNILKYYKTDKPQYFDLSHSKNMALKLATGDIVCMVDADNYAGPKYAEWINSVFFRNGKNTIMTTIRKTFIPLRDQGGKLCFSRELLHLTRGFDESLVGYGIDDVDLVSRMEKANGKRYFIDDEKYLRFIGHTMKERLENHFLLNNLLNVYVVHSELTKEAEVMYLLKDNAFFSVDYWMITKDEKEWVNSYGGWGIKKDGHRQGNYKETTTDLTLELEDGRIITYLKDDSGIIFSKTDAHTIHWLRIEEGTEVFYDVVMGYGECINRKIYVDNDLEERISVNSAGWGEGEVFLNHDRSKMIVVE